jgi:hypothetical protein
VLGVTSGPPNYSLSDNLIKLFCYSDHCNGLRFFYNKRTDRSPAGGNDGRAFYFLHYVCKNCGVTRKLFAVHVAFHEGDADGLAMKIGEVPAFGPITPPRLLRLVQPDRELYLKGRRAESQGMGIGAFAYYRRVIENQKDRLIDEIIKVCRKLKAEESIISALESAKKQFQFENAIESIQDGIPESLKIDEHNPLKLLHAALSKGIHSKSDQECLELAASIRLVLTELADRVDQTLQDHAELSEAVKRLAKIAERKKGGPLDASTEDGNAIAKAPPPQSA